MARRKDPWTSLAFDSWALGMEASAVIGLRMMKLAAGDSRKTMAPETSASTPMRRSGTCCLSLGMIDFIAPP